MAASAEPIQNACDIEALLRLPAHTIAAQLTSDNRASRTPDRTWRFDTGFANVILLVSAADRAVDSHQEVTLAAKKKAMPARSKARKTKAKTSARRSAPRKR